MKEKKVRWHERDRNGGVRVVQRNDVQSGVDLNSGGVNQYPACLPAQLAACSVRSYRSNQAPSFIKI